MESQISWSKASVLSHFQLKTMQFPNVKKVSVYWTNLAMEITLWFSKNGEVQKSESPGV